MRAGFFQSDTRLCTPLERLARLDEALKGDDIDLVACPELFCSGYGVEDNVIAYAEPHDGHFSKAVAEVAERHGVNIIYGYAEEADGVLYNSAQCIGADGQPLGNHRKRVLAGDYEKKLFDRGTEETVFTLENGIKIGVVICYEIEFPEAARSIALAGVDIIVASTATGVDWSFVSRKMVPTRAMENGVFLIYANHVGQEGDWNYLGDSCVVSPKGDDLARAGDVEALLSVELDMSIMEAARKRLPYLVDRHGLL